MCGGDSGAVVVVEHVVVRCSCWRSLVLRFSEAGALALVSGLKVSVEYRSSHGAGVGFGTGETDLQQSSLLLPERGVSRCDLTFRSCILHFAARG